MIWIWIWEFLSRNGVPPSYVCYMYTTLLIDWIQVISVAELNKIIKYPTILPNLDQMTCLALNDCQVWGKSCHFALYIIYLLIFSPLRIQWQLDQSVKIKKGMWWKCSTLLEAAKSGYMSHARSSITCANAAWQLVSNMYFFYTLLHCYIDR